MATERTYDYDFLRRVLREHPDWPTRQVARAVTDHEREVRKDDSFPEVSIGAIASAKYRWRDTWAQQGQPIPTAAKDPTKRSQPFKNVPKEFYYSYLIQNLRVISKLSHGEAVSVKKEAEARTLMRKLDKRKEVIDLTFRGEAITRPARPDELDSEGNLIGYSARFPGLTIEQWSALGSPEARAAASAQWRA